MKSIVKTVTLSTAMGWVAALIVGLVVGWWGAERRAKYGTAEAVEQMLQSIESSDAAETARDVRVIGLIASGETTNAPRCSANPLPITITSTEPAAPPVQTAPSCTA